MSGLELIQCIKSFFFRNSFYKKCTFQRIHFKSSFKIYSDFLVDGLAWIAEVPLKEASFAKIMYKQSQRKLLPLLQTFGGTLPEVGC